MIFEIITLFPKMFEGFVNESILGRAKKNNILKVNIHNLRDWAKDKHKKVDDTPYGGGAGMVLRPDIIDCALNDLIQKNPKSKVILITPQGQTFSQKIAKKLSKSKHLILICGHYEGFDERVRKIVDEEISIGNYVLTGGEIPAMVLVDSISRLLPGVLGKNESHREDSFSMNEFINDSDKNFPHKADQRCAEKLKIDNLNLPNSNWLEYPQYTKPAEFFPKSKKYKKSLTVPKILFSGNHEQIKKWRINESIKKTINKNEISDK